MLVQRATATAAIGAPALPHPGVAVERVQRAALWFAGASISLVFIEPSPYEIVSLGSILLFVATGLTMAASLIPLAVLLIVLNLGYSLSANALLNETNVLTWVLTSWYLAVTALFFAMALTTDTQGRIEALMRGVMVAGVIAALAGVLGYFRLIPGADTLLLYDRARGTFKDPNVYGAFLVLPTMLALRHVIVSRFALATRHLLLLGFFTAAVLLSFSRAAWGQVAAIGALVMLLHFVTAPSVERRLRIILMAVAGAAALGLLVLALASLSSVGDLLADRMSLSKSYDVGETGRFGRHVLGSIMALDRPLGIGPLQFPKFFPEDPHNSYLNAFVSGGWLAGLCYATLILISLGFGLRAVFTPAPWQSFTIVVYAGFVGNAVESAIIDTDHWRHAFLLLGVLWGLIVATEKWRRQAGLAPLARPL